MRPGELISSDRGARAQQPGDLEAAWNILGAVMDPEVPVVSVVELGIVRDLDWRDGHLQVVVTPTYSGCPATEVIEGDIRAALELAGFSAPRLQRRLTPAWSTDWITASGRERLRPTASPCQWAAAANAACWAKALPSAARNVAALTPNSSASSARPPARRCIAAGTAWSRSTISSASDAASVGEQQ